MTSFLAALLMAGAANVSSQHYEHPLPADFNEPIRLYTTGLGTFTRSISSSNAEAQSYFNQGFQLMYGFAKVEAGRSFREAQKRDPECAICYWGEAWAWGPYVNGRMTVAHAERAYAAIQKAVALAEKHANPKEQALIRAMSVRYAQPAAGASAGSKDPARQMAAVGPGPSDRAYADAMARVAAAYPDDLDVGTLYAEALFLLLPGPRAFSVADPTVARVLTVLEGALKRDVRHPGACHLYIHMTELTPEPERAVACAEDTRAIDRLAIRFDRAEPWTSFAICPAPATPAIWSLWEYRWKPAKAGVYRIFLRVVDSSVLQRRLDTGYYVRQVRIAEV